MTANNAKQKRTQGSRSMTPERPQARTSKPRRLSLPAHKLLRLKRIQHPERLPSAWALTKSASAILWRQRRLFLGIVLVYGLLTILFVRGFSGGTDVNELKQQVTDIIGGGAGQVVAGISVFVSLVSASGNNASAAAGAYQLFLGVTVSLATIWVLRQTATGQTVWLKDAFYKGMYPLVPFILVLAAVLLQTLPFLAGGGLLGFVIRSGIVTSFGEILVFGLIFVFLALMSIYWLCSSVFALYIVTLPDMTPMKALRSARQLVHYRRGQVFRKLLFLPVALLVISAIPIFPIIFIFAPAAQWVFFVLTLFWLIAAHAYIYTLYKELLS